MARSKAQMTQAKRAREIAQREKRARKQEKKEARKLGASDPTAETESGTHPESSDSDARPPTGSSESGERSS